MNYRRIRKNHQNTVGTQANDKSTKNAHESAKATKVLRTAAKHDAWTAAGHEKNHQNTVVTQANDESSKNANESAKATKVLRPTAKMIDELLPNMIKAIKIWQGHKVSTKKTTSAKTSAKPTKHYPQCENATWIIAGYEKKTSKYCGHTGWLQRHKECKWKLKINKVLRTTAKMIHELVPHTSKSHQNIVGTQANYESTKYSDEKSKSNKVLRTTAKLMHELLPDRKKVMETLRARRMIRLLPERYDLNRPLVWKNTHHITEWLNGPTFQGLYKFLSRHFTWWWSFLLVRNLMVWNLCIRINPKLPRSQTDNLHLFFSNKQWT